MTEKEKNRIGMFVDELDRISREFGLYISSCGCCNSPHIIDKPQTGKILAADIDFDPKLNRYKYEIIDN